MVCWPSGPLLALSAQLSSADTIKTRHQCRFRIRPDSGRRLIIQNFVMTDPSLPPSAEIASAIKEFLLTEVLPGEDPSLLNENTPLMSTAVLDSTSTLKLILFVEERFGVELEARDTRATNLETIGSIVRTILSKSAKT